MTSKSHKHGKALRIGIVSNTSFNIANYRQGLIKSLQQEGHHIIAISPLDEHTIRITNTGIEHIEIKGLARKGTNPLNDFLLIRELRKIYKEATLDLVLQYTIKPNIYGTFAAKLIGIKTFCTVTGLGYIFLSNGIANTIAKKLYQIAFSKSDYVIFQNQDDEDVFLENGLLTKENHTVFPGSGLDTSFYHPDFCREKEKTHKIIFLMVSRLLTDKGILEYIEAARFIKEKHPETHFQVLGELDEHNPAAISEAQLKEWIQEGVIEYFPFATDIRPYVCQADCIVLPSYREGLPRVIVEGMSMEKFCITTDAPGCKDTLIDGESGLIAKVKNSDSLKEKILEYITLDIDIKNNISKKGRIRVLEKFDQNVVNKKYSDLINRFF